MRGALLSLTRRIAAAACVLGLVAMMTGCAGATGTVSDKRAPTSPAAGAQRIKVASQGQFVPESAARAGTPIALEFGPGDGCTAAVKFDDLGVFEDLTDGGGVVNLPALQAGEYPLVCQSDMVMGVLVVE